ncbi:AraC family transcriptional regulator [Gordonia hydrophobica]|uniref:AraC family transcriptional regulator n=1 Tax=Gordonia hydrophobica TaxID=40516 RepID=A0ABZ2U7D5_9ACTN|nr:AraC family transcriptional regulator [Gordonia hydrophobica]MBM7368076.1 AraC-like DNA-binding protein [Gordonia hydrophobica]
MTMASPLEFRISSGDLIAELKSRAPEPGIIECEWPGLTVYRFDQPVEPLWEEVSQLHLCVIAQGRKCVTQNDRELYYDPFTYLAISGNRPFRTEIIEASPAKPFLSFGLQIEPDLVRQVSSDILLERETAAFMREPAPEVATHGFVSALDHHMMDAILRFLRSLETPTDRRVLAPTYLKEIVYRALQAEQYALLVERAASESASNPVSAVIAYVQEHLAEPLTVSDMAERAFMSPSAFSHLFRDVTGKSPYQFVKELRLNRSRELLIENVHNVTEISNAVGYRSTSHFINEFRERYGMTPRACGEALSTGDLRMKRAQ